MVLIADDRFVFAIGFKTGSPSTMSRTDGCAV